ncbi:hypothetical protein [Mesorhizobium captivum]|uniref:hypothetical protein n=1 Tax=Mesorhizobium captivum TaxID=3072319 RepID=UPI002A24B126|nr:hypothetical protein [Mesorhizobium sp. VK23E]MDX8515125.1 hypothetical protein [Mesorhizobium sp. VK23E]
MMRFKGAPWFDFTNLKARLGASRHDRAVITHRPGCRIKLLSLLCDRNHWWRISRWHVIMPAWGYEKPIASIVASATAWEQRRFSKCR